MKDQAFDLDFDQMVEALEDNEDMVECQECFDLFPKVDCIKLGHAYICPTCRRVAPREPEFDSRMITTDLYDQEFPEVTDYAPDELRDYEKEDTIADAFDMLIKDEYDAIDGYETADEIVQHSDIEADKKDEILDTLDHIKEEEEEHIDELKDVADIEDEESEPLNEACTWVCVFDGEEIGTVEAESEEAALEKMQQEYPEYPYGECDGCFEVFQEADCKVHKAITHPEDERFILNEETELNEETGWIQRGIDTLKNKARAGLRKLTKAAINIDDIFYKGYYIHIENVPEDDMVDADGKPLQDRTTDTLEAAERLAINVSKRLPRAQVYLKGEDEGVKIEDRELQKLIVNKHDWKLARYRGGKVSNSAIEAINKRIKELELSADNIDATSVGTRSSSLDKAKKAAKEALGAKLDPKDYTPESYSAYSASFDSIVSDIDNARSEEELKKLNIETLKKDAEKLLKKKAGSSTDPEDDDDLHLDDDDDDLEAAKAKAKEALGEKQNPEKFTEESYKKYEDNYNRIIDFIDKRTKVEDIEKLDIEALRAKLSKFLRLKPADDTLDIDDEEDESGDELENAKKAALEAMGEKKKPDAYTEDSYAAYSKKFDNAIKFINKQTDIETFKKYNFAQLRARYEALLKEKETDDIPDEEDDTPETTENLDKLKSDLADEILDGMLSKDGYTEDSYNLYEEEINNILESIEKADSVEALNALDAKAKAEEAKELLDKLESDDTSSEEDKSDEEDEETGGKLKRTGKGDPVDSSTYEQTKKKAIEAALNMIKANLGTSPELTAGAATTGDLQAWLDKFKSFFGKDGKRRSEFVFEAFKRKLMRECGDKEPQSLEESFKALREAWESEPTVTCGWCNEEVPQGDCRKEIDLGWICGHCEEAIKSRGEKLVFEEELATTASAVSELKDTEKSLKSAAAGIKNMTSAMKD